MSNTQESKPEERSPKNRYDIRDGHLTVPRPLFYNSLGWTATALFGLTGGITINGAKNLPKPYENGIVAATHDKMVGVVALSEAVRRQKIKMFNMAKDDFWHYPVIGWPLGRIFTAGGSFPVDRDLEFYNQPDVTDRIEDIAYYHGVIDMFPQGTRKNHEKGQLNRRTMKPGVAFIALEYGMDITPASGTDTYTFNNVNFQPRIPVKPVDFDHSLDFSLRKNKDILRDFSHEHIKPLMTEVYEGMNEAQFNAHRDRNQAINDAHLPKSVKQKLRIERDLTARAA